MNIKRALGVGVVFYIASFVVGILTAIIVGVDLTTAASVPTSVWIIGLVTSVIMAWLFSMWYFKGKVEKGVKQGAYLGLLFAAVGFVFDMLVIIPAILTSNAPSDPFLYYSNPFFWGTIILIVGVSALTGKYAKKQ